MRLLLLLILTACATAPDGPAFTYPGGKAAAIERYGSLDKAGAQLRQDHADCAAGSINASDTQNKLDALYAACMAWRGWEKR